MLWLWVALGVCVLGFFSWLADALDLFIIGVLGIAAWVGLVYLVSPALAQQFGGA